ncbi:MAG: NAD(P)-dependent alcohol dehydrogenase [Leptospiraceae bacterium]|nr:NAD(P)-dependent alcohol dehydrogenase [Leptospiraceae bacterium]MBK9503492.1 NAD(P)-dependent alcohol dehydrogenase [Leptospiraceae bacterium]MBP9162502.1 NAD(P)-dependent alcohol dehydrogenase [Leptospiraceae bacterium]
MKIQALAALEKQAELKDFSYESVSLSENDCIVKVHTCGICHSDIHMIDNDWAIAKYPLVPGHEVVGIVSEVGSLVSHLKIGDRVGIGWQSGACMECKDCLRGNENLCSKNKGTIVGRHGGFGSHVQIDSRFCFKIPDELESAVASPLLCAGITVYSALRYAGMTSGQNIGIIGIGGLGHLAVQFAAKLGNRVTVFTTSPDKEKFALENGASEVVVGTPKSTKNKLNIILNTTHNDLDWPRFLSLLDSDGTLTFVGVPPSTLSNVHVGMLLNKRLRIMGSPIGGRAMINEMLEIAAKHKIAPVIEKFPSTRANEAISKVRANKVRYRAVLEF